MVGEAAYWGNRIVVDSEVQIAAQLNWPHINGDLRSGRWVGREEGEGARRRKAAIASASAGVLGAVIAGLRVSVPEVIIPADARLATSGVRMWRDGQCYSRGSQARTGRGFWRQSWSLGANSDWVGVDKRTHGKARDSVVEGDVGVVGVSDSMLCCCYQVCGVAGLYNACERLEAMPVDLEGEFNLESR